MGLNWMCFRGFGGVPPIDMPSSAEGQVVSEQGVVCGAHLPEEAPPFGRGVSLFLNTIGKRSPQLVGFNSHSADLKIMIQRAITRGITAPAFCTRPEKPWGEEADYFARYGDDHVDLKEIVSGFGKGTPSLNELATLSGIPGKMDVDGKGVAGMWLSGDIQGIVAYNEFDALTTYLVWLRTAHFAGFFSEAQYAQEQDFVRNLIKEKTQEPGYGHLKTYLDEWDRFSGGRRDVAERRYTGDCGV